MNDFRNTIQAAGLLPPDHIEPGRFHRFPGKGKTNGNKAGWCKLFDDARGGIFGDFSTGRVDSWQATQLRPLSLAEREAFRRNIEEARAAAEAKRRTEQAEAARLAAKRWADANPAEPLHPYLVAKGVKPHGIRQDGEALLIPMRGGTELHSLQTIAPDGEKRYMAGGRVAGCYFSIGKPGDTVCIAEGYATGATIHEATGHAVAIAFDCGNLKAVAQAVRDKLSNARIIVCADDDNRTLGNPGIAKATEAAHAVRGLLALPDFGPDRPDRATDFNDLHRHRGREAVEHAIANARASDVSAGQLTADKATAVDLNGPRVAMIRGDTVNPEPVRWIWPGWLARGKLHVLAGTAGTGKTTLALAMAASVTIGGRWPDGSRAELGSVVIWSGEDDPADTLVPRLLAMGADMSRVHFVGAVLEAQGRRAFDPAQDVPLLAERLRGSGDVALLVVDPIVSAVAADSHKNGEVRRSLQPLVDVAAAQGCALVGITHYSKSTSGRDPLERVTGSLAFGALPRIVMGTAKPTEAGSMRRLVRAKSNIGPDGGGFEYALQQTEVPGTAELYASRVLWGEPIDGTARELLAEVETDPSDDGGESPNEFLRYLLAAGPMPATSVFRDAEAHGYSKRQMQRARTAIGAHVAKQGMRGGWEWSLPKVPFSPEDTEDATHGSVEPSAPSEHSSAETGEVF